MRNFILISSLSLLMVAPLCAEYGHGYLSDLPRHELIAKIKQLEDRQAWEKLKSGLIGSVTTLAVIYILNCHPRKDINSCIKGFIS